MPAASSSRRKPLVRRQNSSDIEDARPSQPNGREDDVSDEDQPRPTRTIVKKERKKGKQKAVQQPQSDEEEGAAVARVPDSDSDEDDRVDVTQFPDHPLDKPELLKLTGLVNDWNGVRNQVITATDYFKELGSCLAEATQDIESKELTALDTAMRENINLVAEMGSYSKALEALIQKVAQGQEIIGAPREFQDNFLSKELDEYAGKTSRQKFAKDERYKEFRSIIWEVFHPEDPLPPLTTIIAQEPGDEDDDDDDVEMGGVTQNFNCALSLKPLFDPLTLPACGHSFSEKALKDYCRAPGQSYQCPATGCSRMFKLNECRPDPALAKRVRAHMRRKQAAEDEDADDAEEIID